RDHHGVHVPTQVDRHRGVGRDVGDQFRDGRRAGAGVPQGQPLEQGELMAANPRASRTTGPRRVASGPPAPGGETRGRRGSALRVRAGRLREPRTLAVAVSAWLLAALFLAPYLEMVVTALRPAGELRDRGYLPDRLEWSNLVDVWREPTLADNLQVSLVVAGGATVLVLLVSLPAA